MSSMLGSQGVVLATAMVVSTTVLFLAFSKQKTTAIHHIQHTHSANENLRSCLCSDERRRHKKKKNKRVHFAENVKDTKGNGEEYRREIEENHRVVVKQRNRNSIAMNDGVCRNEIPGIHQMPANRVALYNGILRDRVHRMEYSY